MTAPLRQMDHHGHDHGNAHEHDHAGGHVAHAGAGGRKGLLIALSITLFMMLAEIVGGRRRRPMASTASRSSRRS
ncbi:MAG: hypothetical protein H6Q96_785 [Nitrospirae bacterium]|nr:hypothetical protein [Nitrospirota bacterium]